MKRIFPRSFFLLQMGLAARVFEAQNPKFSWGCAPKLCKENPKFSWGLRPQTLQKSAPAFGACGGHFFEGQLTVRSGRTPPPSIPSFETPPPPSVKIIYGRRLTQTCSFYRVSQRLVEKKVSGLRFCRAGLQCLRERLLPR